MWITVRKSWNPCQISEKRRFTSSPPLSAVFHGIAPDRASPIVLSCWAGLAGWVVHVFVWGLQGFKAAAWITDHVFFATSQIICFIVFKQ